MGARSQAGTRQTESYLSSSLQPPKVFISSRQDELADERAYVKKNLRDKGIDSFTFESDARASPSSPEKTFLEVLNQSDVYIGSFCE